MYIDPWNNIEEYPSHHRNALNVEIRKEIGDGHVLNKLDFDLLAKREDCDDVLVYFKGDFFIVHLTWSGKAEQNPYPKTNVYDSRKKLESKLALDAELF